MTAAERLTLLAELRIKLDRALSGASPNIQLTQEVVGELSKLRKADRPFFRDFAIQLTNEMFGRGASVKGLDLRIFEPVAIAEAVNGDVEDPADELDEDLSQPPNDPSWFDVFKVMYEGLGDGLQTLKGYFFLRLMDGSSSNEYRPLLVYDAACHQQPVEKRLRDSFGRDIDVIPLETLDERLESRSFPEGNFVAILLLSTRINEQDSFDELQKKIKSLLAAFDSFQTLAVRPPLENETLLTRSRIERNSSASDLLEEIEYGTTILLTNAEISFDEEKVIKRLFWHLRCPVLEYRVIKGGKSGSRVFEIRPRIGDQSRRYIVKFGPASDKRKLWKEYRRFGQHIEIYSIEGYPGANHRKNAAVECLQYVYASRNAIERSYSFDEILSENSDAPFEPSSTLTELFKNPAFVHWNEKSVEKGTFLISSLYGDYVKEERFAKTLIRVKGLSATDVKDDPLMTAFCRIADYELKTQQKNCHGDLHSGNFFRDEQGVYLIDFGFTGKRHALIDHAMLECSIKFNHVPKYVEPSLLEKIEKQLVADTAFTASFEVNSDRKDIKRFFNLIGTIRADAIRLKLSSESNLEYLVALFMITCRLMEYDDLNQLYALNSAEILADRISEIFNLSA